MADWAGEGLEPFVDSLNVSPQLASRYETRGALGAIEVLYFLVDFFKVRIELVSLQETAVALLAGVGKYLDMGHLHVTPKIVILGVSSGALWESDHEKWLNCR